ncbi:MAG: DUF1178 family protein [Parasphingorhabdus sp.]|uniref:DUF1178 family protein n=1 Tax=Parasphingorhabdus sp. TaxID=2709688 RepID=UPI0032971397
MIVFDLICRDGGHQFEGWFGSSSDYESQQAAGLIDCPTCGCTAVDKAVMAPNVAMKANQRNQTPVVSGEANDGLSAPAEKVKPAAKAVAVPAEYQELVTKLAKAQAKMLEKSEWVGGNFPEKARAIHYGEENDTPIHGTASEDDVAELEDEGIDVMPLPLPVTPPDAQN